MARVVVGMSGGVDSSVVAWMLKEQGHEVIGLFMRNWNDASVTLEDECPWIDDSRDAMIVAEQLGIPFQVLDLSEDYKARIVDYMFAEYAAGRTPNPDVLCNREIKFDVFLKNALKLGADFVATGHYVQKDEIEVNGKPVYRLMSGKDPNKDQSYFLCQLTQEQLAKSLFPIGGLLKSEVRELAVEAGLATAAKKDSQGLCFIGKVSLPEFLQQQLKPKTGKVIEIAASSPSMEEHQKRIFDTSLPPEIRFAHVQLQPEDGMEVGEHNGAHYYTIGQRRGLSIGGKPLPLFVLKTDVVNNIVYVGQGEDHPGLLSSGLVMENPCLHWVRPDLNPGVNSHFDCLCRIRYRQALFECQVIMTENRHYLQFAQAQKSVTSGQFAALYLDRELVASGTIA
ncbi:MAG: tRNA 2-thiouridine(34) synthase MnmA [Bacteroidetes bacterium]|nr:tRNA 2-thiouridine(34) synthase MnmA [Bacteroidota bacterium]